MQKLIFAAAGFVIGVIVGGMAAMWYLDDEYADQQRLMMTLHGTNRAIICQQPEARRPKNVDCRGISP